MLVVFLHGFLGSSSDWHSVIQHLPFDCLTFDLPGHGTSPATFDLFAALDKLPPFHLVGYSLGGRIALQYPGKPLSLTLLSTHLGLKTGHEARLLQDQALAQTILSTPIDEFLQQWYDQPLFQSLRTKMDICSLRKHQDRLGLAATLVKFSLGKQADYSKVQAHFLLGEEDAAYRTLYEQIPHTLIPSAGHAVHLENPIHVAKEIYAYLRSI